MPCIRGLSHKSRHPSKFKLNNKNIKETKFRHDEDTRKRDDNENKRIKYAMIIMYAMNEQIYI